MQHPARAAGCQEAKVDRDRAQVGGIVEAVAAEAAIQRSSDGGLVGEHEIVGMRAAHQVLDLREGDFAGARQHAGIGAGQVPGAIGVLPEQGIGPCSAIDAGIDGQADQLETVVAAQALQVNALNAGGGAAVAFGEAGRGKVDDGAAVGGGANLLHQHLVGIGGELRLH